MSEPTSLQSLLDAAERAASAGGFGAAQRLLEQAVTVQELELGPAHPDLASTLNNLGVVCERTNHMEEAERCYRRACALTAAGLAPDHPSVLTSRRNLEEFCAARGISVDAIVPGMAAPPDGPGNLVEPIVIGDATESAAALEAVSFDPEIRPAPTMVAAASTPRRRGGRALASVVSGGVLVLALAAWFGLSRGTPASVPGTSAPAASSASSVGTPPHTAAGTTGGSPESAATAPDGDGPAVVEARLCASLSIGEAGGAWTCTPLTDPASPGRVYFYTRIRSASDLAVVHRWYRDDRLERSSTLQIRANPGAGYRTYSEQTVAAGRWRVELAASDGRILQEASVVVR
jgi:Tetratricopeptide repeat/Protein of unknown function (DUF2914)